MFSEKKGVIIGLLLTLFLMGVIGLYAEFAGGNGTKEDPWLIETAEHLNNIRNYEGTQGFDKYFKQIADIDLGVSPWNEGEGWEPIGHYYSDKRFFGHYDGNEFTISNLSISRPEESMVGLFGDCRGAELLNITLKSAKVEGFDYVGMLAGSVGPITGEVKGIHRIGKVSGCSVQGTIAGNSRVGGLVGSTFSSIVEKSSAKWSTLRRETREPYDEGLVIGGFIGSAGYSIISDCFVVGNYFQTHFYKALGDFIGIANGNIEINNCYAHIQHSWFPLIGAMPYPPSVEINNSYHKVSDNYPENDGDLSFVDMTHPYKENVYVDWDFNNVWTADYTDTFNYGLPFHRKKKNTPYVANNPTPEINEPAVASAKLSWDPTYNEAADNIPVGFYVSIGTDNPPTNIVHNEVVIANAFYEIKEKLELGTMYYWQVIPFNNLGEAEDCPIWYFTTKVEGEGPFAGGFGTELDPWLVETAEQLDKIRDYTLEGYHFLQIDDIDLGVTPWNEGNGWSPIGDSNWRIFDGVYDGGGHTISGLFVHGDEIRQGGLFCNVNNGKVANLTLADVNISSKGSAGGIAVSVVSSSIINCHVSGTVEGYYSTGGIVGIAYGLIIDRCSFTGSIPKGRITGGICGEMYRSSMFNSYNRGDISGELIVGGLTGVMYYVNAISNSYSEGKVYSEITCWPLVGNGLIGGESNYWNLDVFGYEDVLFGEGRTTEEMIYPYGANTYVGWDFDNVWVHDVDHSVNDGYPYLCREINLSADKSDIVKPLSMSLKNYPNPFNPETTISFNLPMASEVELSIYNIKGQLVERVINTQMQVGQHKVVWNGNGVSSGLYFYKLTTPEGSLINKMMLLK
ncbi:MAG: T9SS type A sorting domain-containing protein [Candidatus Cloacimonadia bacterium]